MSATAPLPEIRVTRTRSGYEMRLGSGGVFRNASEKVTAAKTFKLADGNIVGTWKEGSAFRYLVSSDGEVVLREAPADSSVRLQAATFDPIQGIPVVPAEIPTPSDNEIRIVQFHTQPLPSYLSELEGLGVTVYDVVAPNAAIVRAPVGVLKSVKALGYVRWVGTYESAYRLDKALVDPLVRGELGTKRYNIWCHQRGTAMQSAIGDRIALLGGTVEQSTPQGFIISATLTPVQLTQVLGMNEVSYVDEWTAPSQDMDVVRGWQGANFIESTLGFTGQGVRAEVMDGGLLQTHVAWTNPPLVHAPSLPVDSHGTATFGINFGNGNANAAGRGLLPNGQGVMANYNSMSGGNRYTHTSQLLAAPYFCVFQSNSWGNAQTTSYTTISAEMDDILFLNDVVILNSQSNTGNQTSRPQAWAKNMVSIGGTSHFGTANTADDTWGGASIGPASDGRIKPELANCYDSILCPTSSSTTAYTAGFNGTSAATPITAGHFGLFFQMWHSGVFGNPAPATTVFDNRPKQQFAKAIMINTANQYPLAPQQANITRFVQGWGIVNLTNLYGIRNNLFYINETDVLQNLQTATHKVIVAPGTTALRATMSYLEPQGSPTPAIARKNNLSLKVTAPNGTTFYWGNTGMTTNNWTTANGTEDSLNTVENVFIQNPTAGVYTIQVIGSDINTDARTETVGVIDADFALVVTGVVNGNLAPSAFSVADGGLVSGNLASLSNSDNNTVAATRGSTTSRNFRSVINMTFTSPSATASKLAFALERRAGIAGCSEKIEVLDTTTSTWVVVSNATTALVDTVSTFELSSPQRFLGAGGAIQARCTYERQDTLANRTPPINIDYARMRLEP